MTKMQLTKEYKYKKLCVVCGDEFHTNHGHKTTCGVACQRDRATRNKKKSYYVNQRDTEQPEVRYNNKFLLRGSA